MNEPIIRIRDILLDAYWAANQGRPDVPEKFQVCPTAEHRWREQYRERTAQIALQKIAA